MVRRGFGIAPTTFTREFLFFGGGGGDNEKKKVEFHFLTKSTNW